MQTTQLKSGSQIRIGVQIYKRENPNGQRTYEQVFNLIFIRKLQIQTRVRYNYTATKMINTKSIGSPKCCWDVE